MRSMFLALPFALAACATPPAPTSIGGEAIAPVGLAEGRPAPAPLRGLLHLPPGEGPKPVVILLYGCGGMGAATSAWASRVESWGYGTLVLDSFGPRGVATVCAPDKQHLVTRYDRAADVVAAVRWLRTQPGVDPHRIAVIGHSQGGGSAMTVTVEPYAAEVAGSVRGVVDYYGPCRDLPRYSGIPLLALAGDDDTWGNPARTCRTFKADAPPGSDITVQTYPGVVHVFDNPHLLARRWNEGHPMQYDREAAEDSFARVRAFLARVLGARVPE